VLGLAFSVGTVLWFDLRLVGLAMRRYRVSETFAYVQPWMIGGFVLMMMTGTMLLWAHPVQAYGSGYFRVKLVLLFLAAANISMFHLTVDRRRAAWDDLRVPPLRVRLAGAASLVLWFGIVAVGRLMAYNFV
jgi:hypothetical protein